MAHTDTFCWQEGAGLFAGTIEIARPSSVEPQGFRTIPARHTLTTLSELGDALVAKDSFCITDKPLPQGCETSAPDFFTLTGGSTGDPKVIHRTQASWIASFEVNCATFELPRLRALAVLGSLDHSLALYGVLEGLHTGLDVHVLNGLGTTQQHQLLRENRIGVLYATPTQLWLLAREAAAPLPDIKVVFCGGGALDAATARQVHRICPNAALHRFYGAAETSFITMTDKNVPQDSVGRPYPGVEIKLHEGELWVRSPYLFKGYAAGHSPETRWHEGYLSVGELGRIDDLGHLWITGRKSRLVNIADQLVSPEVVENHVMGQTHDTPCAALPVADATRGQRLVLVLEGAEDAARANAVKKSCRDRFGSLVAPRRVYFHPKLPLLSSGKVDLGQLSRWVEEQE